MSEMTCFSHLTSFLTIASGRWDLHSMEDAGNQTTTQIISCRGGNLTILSITFPFSGLHRKMALILALNAYPVKHFEITE
jgi:hypothetical protein